MNKLPDYSGEFLPNLKFTDFSPDTLADLIMLYSRIYLAMDGFWYLAIKDRIGNEEALACDIQAWAKMCKYEMARITKLLNIQGNDITALAKALQTIPWIQNLQSSIEIIDSNSALFTVTECPTLLALEREGEGREEQICRIFDPKVFKDYASFFDPNAEVYCLKSPPRKDKGEIWCQWKFTVGDAE